MAHVEEIPGVDTEGRTFAEARRTLKEAWRLVLEAKRGLITVSVGVLAVKRGDLLCHLAEHGGELLRKGSRHAVHRNPRTGGPKTHGNE